MAKKRLIAAFARLDYEDLAGTYRRKMASLLFRTASEAQHNTTRLQSALSARSNSDNLVLDPGLAAKACRICAPFPFAYRDDPVANADRGVHEIVAACGRTWLVLAYSRG